MFFEYLTIVLFLIEFSFAAPCARQRNPRGGVGIPIAPNFLMIHDYTPLWVALLSVEELDLELTCAQASLCTSIHNSFSSHSFHHE